MKIKTNTNLTSGILFLIVSVILYLLIPSQIQTIETTQVTARTVPSLLFLVMMFCSVILIIQGILNKDKKTYIISSELFKDPAFRKEAKTLIYIVMLLAYALIMPHIGFVPASLLLTNGIIFYFGARKWYFYAIASANVLIAYFVFCNLLQVSLP